MTRERRERFIAHLRRSLIVMSVVVCIAGLAVVAGVLFADNHYLLGAATTAAGLVSISATLAWESSR